MDVANKSLIELKSDLKNIAANYGPCDIVAADIEDGTTDNKVVELIDLCHEISYEYKIA
jgi:hypothetical protein